MKNDYIPEKEAWLVFDLSNGHPGVRQYVWWFRTRQEARDHVKKQHSNPKNARLSAPQKWVKGIK